MKKKRLNSKLRLARETVRHISSADLAGAAGGQDSSSHNCSMDCANFDSDGGNSYCWCPDCPDHSAGCTGGGPIYTGPFWSGCPSAPC